MAAERRKSIRGGSTFLELSPAKSARRKAGRLCKGGGNAERGQGTRRRRPDGEAPPGGDAVRRGLPRADHAPDRRPPRAAARERGSALGREEHPDPPGGRGRR